MEVEYSICITNYNTYPYLIESLNSIFSMIDSRFEVVVVDNLSKDGSLDILRQYAEKRMIKLIEAKCSRGKGRELAFENSIGKYIISAIDLDDVTGDVKPAIQLYYSKVEGYLLVLEGLIIGPRRLIQSLGGWRDLNWGEDFDLWSRAAEAGKLVYLNLDVRKRVGRIWGKSFAGRAKHTYIMYRDSFRLGRPVKEKWEEKNFLFKLAHITIMVIALMSYRFYPCYRRKFNESFRLIDYEMHRIIPT